MRGLAVVAACLVGASPVAAQSPPSLTELFNRVDPAVVEIATIQESLADTGPGRMTRSGGMGSGFLVSEDGVIMTAAHVVQLAEDVAVRWITGDVSEAEIISANPNADVAIIRAKTVPASVKPLVLGDSHLMVSAAPLRGPERGQTSQKHGWALVVVKPALPAPATGPEDGPQFGDPRTRASKGSRQLTKLRPRNQGRKTAPERGPRIDRAAEVGSIFRHRIRGRENSEG